MSDTILTTYGELADIIEQLPLLVESARRSRRLSQRALARELGLSPSTVCRVEDGQECSSVTLAAVLRWLDTGAAS